MAEAKQNCADQNGRGRPLTNFVSLRMLSDRVCGVISLIGGLAYFALAMAAVFLGGHANSIAIALDVVLFGLCSTCGAWLLFGRPRRVREGD